MLVDAAPKILPEIPTRLGEYAGEAARRARCRHPRRHDARVGRAACGARSRTATGSATQTLVWTAGVKANPRSRELGLPLDERGRVRVDATLRVEGHSNVWSLGDARASRTLATPGRARPADLASTPCGRPAGSPRTSPATPRPYRYRMLGQVATLGRYKGIADVLGIRLRGFLGWFVTRTLPPLPAAALLEEAAGRRRLDHLALLPPRHRRALDARPPAAPRRWVTSSPARTSSSPAATWAGAATSPRRTGAPFTPTRLPRRPTATTSGSSATASRRSSWPEAPRLERRLMFVPEPGHWERVEPWFAERGWRIDRHLVMAQLREPERRADLSLVSELDEEDLRPARRRLLGRPAVGEARGRRAALPGEEPDRRARDDEVLRRRADGEVVSYTDLYMTEPMPRSRTSARFPSTEAAATRGRSCSRRSRQRGAPVPSSSSSSQMPRIGPRSCTVAWASTSSATTRSSSAPRVDSAGRPLWPCGGSRSATGGRSHSRGVDLEVGEGELVGLLGPERRRQVDAGQDRLRPRPCVARDCRVCGAPRGLARGAPPRSAISPSCSASPGWYSADELLELHQRLSGSDGRRGRARTSCSSSSGSATRARAA